VSTSETFSIASLEAMAMGKPMIMSDVGGAREQVQHGVNGFLFRAGDVRALAQCLRESSNKSRTRELGEAARQKVSRDFSLQSMLEAYGSLLREIVARHTPAVQKIAGRKLPS
jgi:glycosyltransferase involved in cell wall biosynthesis